jgi:hypothetical protein
MSDQATGPQRGRPTVTQTAATALVLLLVALLAARSAASLSAAQASRSGPRRPSAATMPTGCTLAVQGVGSLVLSDALAMRLTDIAGMDQNHAATLAHTAAAVAGAWPAQAADAAAITESLRGYVPAALACAAQLAPAPREGLRPDGLTLRANAMWDAVKRVFGPLPAGGFAPGGVHAGHIPGSAHYEGRAIDFLYRPITAKSIRHGWVLAQWLEAHAADLAIAHVIFDDQVWAPGTWATRAWQPYTDPQGPTADPTLLHMDHVHVDVLRGT